jgi:hypothetical protein
MWQHFPDVIVGLVSAVRISNASTKKSAAISEQVTAAPKQEKKGDVSLRYHGLTLSQQKDFAV